MMQITVYANIDKFLETVQPVLRENEAANNLMLGVAFRVQNDAHIYGNSVFSAAVHENDRLLAAALMTSPYNLIVYCAEDDCPQAWKLLAEELLHPGLDVPGVNGQTPHVRGFVQAWKSLSSDEPGKPEQRRTFELRQVIWPQMPGGTMRKAVLDDLKLVTAWSRSFEDEALGPNEARIRDERIQKQIENGEMFLWIDEQPASMAAAIRPLGDGISIAWVYTPPEKRKHGYASALVASLSQYLLEHGYKYCTLFTDLANPTSNKIYQQIGYKPICDYESIPFISKKG
jgi:predicted GNAT family acetyltransferase